MRERRDASSSDWTPRATSSSTEARRRRFDEFRPYVRHRFLRRRAQQRRERLSRATHADYIPNSTTYSVALSVDGDIRAPRVSDTTTIYPRRRQSREYVDWQTSGVRT